MKSQIGPDMMLHTSHHHLGDKWKTFAFSGKVRQKPLLLLKMLIVLGGVGVGVEQVTDLLWPESEGDAAYSAFTSTLSRLRQIFGIDGIIRSSASK